MPQMTQTVQSVARDGCGVLLGLGVGVECC